MLFSKKKNPIDYACAASCDLVTHSLNGSIQFLKEIIGEINVNSLLTCYIEFLIFLIHITDKLASNRYNNVVRGEIMKKMVDDVKDQFVLQTTFNEIIEDKDYFFEKYFHDVFYTYPPKSAIYGHYNDDVTSYFCQRLSNIFLNDVSEEGRNFMQNTYYQILEAYINAYHSFKSVRNFLKD